MLGDDLFNITGGDVAAGGSGLCNAHFDGQNPLALTGYDGTYRLTFTDSVSGLSQYASSSIGTNYIDLRMQASVAPEAVAAIATVPEPGTFVLLGLGLAGLGFTRRKQKPMPLWQQPRSGGVCLSTPSSRSTKRTVGLTWCHRSFEV